MESNVFCSTQENEYIVYCRNIFLKEYTNGEESEKHIDFNDNIIMSNYNSKYSNGRWNSIRES